MTAEERIFQVSVEAMRELSLERLREERKQLRTHIEEAIAFTERVIDLLIEEKTKQRLMN